MTNNEIKEMTNKAIELDKKIKSDSKILDGYKAQLQAEGLQILDNKNLKQVEFSGDSGVCRIQYKQKLEVDNLKRLIEAVGDIAADMATIERTVSVKYDGKFKEALIALYSNNYKQHDIYQILLYEGLEHKQIEVIMKKLKGDYYKDFDLLKSYGLQGELEELLDAVKEQKCYELVNRFFDIDKVDRDKLNLALSVEESLAVGLSHQG